MIQVTNSFIVSLIFGSLMVSAAVISKVFIPSKTTNSYSEDLNLDKIIQKEFDGWKVDSSAVNQIVNVEIKDSLEKIYNQTLSRTYINHLGSRVMLSIAYGGIQQTDMHAHRPEICYSAGGFEISNMHKTNIATPIGQIPAMQLVARQGSRIEPITYWIRIGNTLTRGWVEQKLSTIFYGLKGELQDGILVRVSSISNNEQEAYRIQQKFLSALLKSIRKTDQYFFVGQLPQIGK